MSPASLRLLTPLALLWACSGGPGPGTTDDSGASLTPTQTGTQTGSTTAVDDGCSDATGDASYDSWGGDQRVDLGAQAAFTLTELCGRWWFVTPDGHPMWSVGMNSTNPTGSTDQLTGLDSYGTAVDKLYADDDGWADSTAARLTSWGVNTVGAWSATSLLLPRMATTINLNIAQDDWETGDIADYFDPAWQDLVQTQVAALAQPDDDNLIGYFIDNEIRWGPDWRDLRTLSQTYLELSAKAPGKVAAVAVLLDVAGDVDTVNDLLGTDFADQDALLSATTGFDALSFDAVAIDPSVGPEGLAAQIESAMLSAVADQYFSVTTATIRAADPNHLILGNREVSVMTRPEIYLAQAPYVDLISVNRYQYVDGLESAALTLSSSVDPGGDLAAIHDLTGLPLLVTEFGFRADDAGLPNSWPPVYPTYDTQAQRADAFETQALTWQEVPWLVGYHWYRWVDDPPGGRFDGEDNNWGVVDSQDTVYQDLTERMTQVNARAALFLRVPD